jgi:hypothetical protein
MPDLDVTVVKNPLEITDSRTLLVQAAKHTPLVTIAVRSVGHMPSLQLLEDTLPELRWACGTRPTQFTTRDISTLFIRNDKLTFSSKRLSRYPDFVYENGQLIYTGGRHEH